MQVVITPYNDRHRWRVTYGPYNTICQSRELDEIVRLMKKLKV